MNNLLNKIGIIGFIILFTTIGTGIAVILNNLSNNLELVNIHLDVPLLHTITGIGGSMNTSYIQEGGLITFLGDSYGGETLLLNTSIRNRANVNHNGTFKMQLTGNVTGGEFSQVQVRFYDDGVWSSWNDVTDLMNTSPYTLSNNLSWNSKEEILYQLNATWSPLIGNGSYGLNFTVTPN